MYFTNFKSDVYSDTIQADCSVCYHTLFDTSRHAPTSPTIILVTPIYTGMPDAVVVRT